MSPAAKLPAIRVLEEFLIRQAELLDRRDWDEWIELFADDGVYWMPLKEDQQDAENYPSIFFEDKALMPSKRTQGPRLFGWGWHPSVTSE